MILLIEYFKHPNEDRHNEYIQCLKENILNDQISKIDVIISDGVELPISDDKIVITNRETRPTYNDFFRISNTKYPNKICIIANSDIIMTDLSMLNDSNMENRFVALSRWDINRNGKLNFFDREDSQDVWIFKTPISIKTPPNFHLGKPGCDNRIAYMAWESGLIVNNPSKQIITKHLHLTNLRNYGFEDTVFGMHMRIKPCESLESNSVLTRLSYPKR